MPLHHAASRMIPTGDRGENPSLPGVAKLSLETLLLICRPLELRSLLALRATFRRLAWVVAQELRRSLRSLMAAFVPYPSRLLKTITDAGGYIGGDVAARFLLRTDTWRPDKLEIYVGREQEWKIENELVYEQGAWPTRGRSIAELRGFLEEGQRTKERDIEATTIWEVSGAQLTMHRTTESEPLRAITSSWASHRVVYVNGTHFGCGYRDLFFAKRSLLGGAVRSSVTVVNEARVQGFDLQYTSRGWEDEEGGGCGTTTWQCPAQTRTFEDGGGMHARLDPLSSDPLVFTGVWKLDERPCGAFCTQ